MNKKRFASDVLSVIFLVLNAISMVCFWLPPGRADYMSELLVQITMLLSMYAVLGGMAISCVIGIVLNVISVLLKRKRALPFKSNILYLILFTLSLPCAWFAFQAAMSV